MQLRKRKAKVEPYDMWGDEGAVVGSKKTGNKLHPSQKRDKKTPIPHPGQSYNPDPEDHANLIKKIARKELQYKKKQASINKSLNIRVDPKELQQHEKEQEVAGIEHLIPKKDSKLIVKNDDSDASSTDSAYGDYDEKDFEAILKDKVVKEERKTRRQRLGQLKDKLQRKAAKLRKLKNIRLSRIDAVKKITKELDKKEKEMKAKEKKHKHKKIKNERLGFKFEQSDPIYCLPSELPSNLRSVTCPMDKIVREQLESFQSRLMVEPTNFQIKKTKYKKKAFDRKAADEQD